MDRKGPTMDRSHDHGVAETVHVITEPLIRNEDAVIPDLASSRAAQAGCPRRVSP
jgi:hypothetical protein